MNSYRIYIAGAPKVPAAIFRRDIQKYWFINVLPHVLVRHPALCSASGTLPYFRAITRKLSIATVKGTRSVASAAGWRDWR